MTNEERNRIEKLKNLLHDDGMTIDDVMLLYEAKDQSNILFHSNEQKFNRSKGTNQSILDDLKIYKLSLQSAELKS